MEMMRETVYFKSLGRSNTDRTLSLAHDRADELGVKNIVVASSRGDTGVKASDIFMDFNLVVVTSVPGYREPNVQRLTPENRGIIEARGSKIVTAAHAFGSIGRAINRKFDTIQVDEIIAHALRIFCAGVKVCCEVTCMAADAGLIRTDEEAIAISGTKNGADTAIVVRPSNTHTFFDMRVLEIICKPRGK
jgi:hypothetical protein